MTLTRILGAAFGAIVFTLGLVWLGAAVDFSATAPISGTAGAAADRKVIADFITALGAAVFGFGFMVAAVFAPLPWEASKAN